MNEKIQATVAILTHNSGKTLGRALESVRDFDDIIVCDGYSSDETREIALKYGARVIDQDARFHDSSGRIIDYAGVRNQTLDAARHNAFFFLDSDEYIDAELCAAVRHAVEEKSNGAFWVSRKYVRGGHVIEHATTYPNRQVRMFFRSSAERFIKRVHERIELREGVVPETLDGTLMVPFDMTIEELREKWRYQAEVEVLRIGSMTPLQYLGALMSYAKVSLLYLMRHIRILTTGGTRMPLAFEMERHVQHLRLSRALWRIVKVR